MNVKGLLSTEEQFLLLFLMERARNEIIESTIDSSTYFWSILEKQNDSGIYFNERLFFLQSQKSFGYLSDPKANLTASTLSKAKAVYSIDQIKNVASNEKQLVLKFTVEENNRKFQRTWLMRVSTEDLAKKWQDKLKFQKTKEVLSKTSPKLLQQESQFVKNGGVSAVKDRNLSVNRTIAFSANPKLQKQSKQIGINAEPPESLEPIHPLKLVETRQYGTMMSQKNDLNPSRQSIEPEVKEANIEASFVQNPKKSEGEAEVVQQTNRSSSHKPGTISRSQFSGNKLEAGRKSTHKGLIAAEQNDGKQTHTNYAQKNESNVSVASQGVIIARSKSQDPPLTPEKPDRQQVYYDRTSRLIKQSSISNRPYVQPIKEEPMKEKEEISPYLQFKPTEKEPQPIDRRLPSLPLEHSQPPKQPGPKLLEPSDIPLISEEGDSVVDNLEEVPWTYKYIKYREHMFHEFVEYTQDLLKELLRDMHLPRQNQHYQLKFIKNGIRYFEVNDVEVKIAMIELIRPETGTWNEREKICSKDGIKMLQNQYNNYQTLYEYLGADSKLKVPLLCLNEINGTVALFKVLSKGLEQQVRMRELEPDLQLLKTFSKIDHNFHSNSSKYLVQLDASYYNKFKQQDNEYDSHISFDYVFIQQLEGFLLKDTVTDRDYGECLLRKELVELYADGVLKKEEKDKKTTPLKITERSRQPEQFQQNVLKAISGAIQQIDSLQAYFFSSGELSQYLHSRGINVRYLGHIYPYIHTKFQKEFIMSELAARSCKALFRKTIQDLTIEESPAQKDLNIKLCDFFNCILGNTYETGAIWKLLSSHCKNYYDLDINFDEVHRGTFIISLVENCQLDVVWERINPQEIFKSNFFFSQRNLKGIRGTHKIYPPFYNSQFRNALAIISKEESQEGYETLLTDFNLDTTPLPQILTSIESEVKKYLAYFTNPSKPALPHLQIYAPIASSPPSRTCFDIGLIKIKWLLKLKAKEQYIKSCDQFIQKATKYYGEYHPIFSQLYDVFSAYHSSHGQFQDAITFAKSSLVNTLSLCGTHHQKTSECYFYLALYYLKANRGEEAVHNFKKAKKILEHNNTTSSLSYVSILIKLALLHLNQNQMGECLTYSEQALAVLEVIGEVQCEDQVTQCYEMMARCFEVEGNQRRLRDISQQISQRLSSITGRDNLQKMMKMFLYPVLAALTPQSASNYLDVISQLPKELPPNSEAITFELLKDRVQQGNFDLQIFQYFKRMTSITEYIRSIDLLKGWNTFGQVYERETVNDFVNLTEQLYIFLGEGFLTGALREAL